MLKRSLLRGLNSFMYAAGINVVIYTIIMVISDDPDFLPMLPEYAAHFSSDLLALLVQCCLIGLCSAMFGAGSILMELERLSLLTQSILYFIITTAIWFPVSCFCWGLQKYPSSIIGVGFSYTISYIISWIFQYRSCKHDVEQINQQLKVLQKNQL